MWNQGMVLGAMLCASLTVGCTGEELSGDDALEFRHGGGLGFADPSYPGNGDIEIRGGGDDDDDIPDAILWDLDGGNVSRQVEAGVFIERFSVEEDRIRSESASVDTPTCVAVEGDHPSGKVFHLVDENDEVVLTVWDCHVFAGDVSALGEADVDCGSGGSSGGASLVSVESQAAFSFKSDRIHAGHWSDGSVVATVSEEIDEASPMRRLTVAALVAGECGSNGLP